MRTFNSIDELAESTGQPIGHSEWTTITQEAVNLFADATGDHQWIHVDTERAANGPFGTTIAHGYMTLALLPQLMQQIYSVDGVKMGINYGVNKVRFPAPVPVGSKIRAESAVVDVTDLGEGAYQATLSTTVSIEGGAKPACVAESIVRYLT
jgi:acyl dehydratase